MPAIPGALPRLLRVGGLTINVAMITRVTQNEGKTTIHFHGGGCEYLTGPEDQEFREKFSAYLQAQAGGATAIQHRGFSAIERGKHGEQLSEKGGGQ